jgi:hypothetical protein
MKKFIYFLTTIFLFILLLTGCEEEELFPQSTIEKFLGKWEGTLTMPGGEIISINLELQQKQKESSNNLAGYFVEIQSQDKIKIFYNLEELSRIKNDSTVMLYFHAKYDYCLTGTMNSAGDKIDGTYTITDVPGVNQIWGVKKIESPDLNL